MYIRLLLTSAVPLLFLVVFRGAVASAAGLDAQELAVIAGLLAIAAALSVLALPEAFRSLRQLISLLLRAAVRAGGRRRRVLTSALLALASLSTPAPPARAGGAAPSDVALLEPPDHDPLAVVPPPPAIPLAGADAAAAAPGPIPPAVRVADDTGSARPATETHVVAPGENLWVIARAVLLEQEGAMPDDRAVHAYWLRLIRANEPGFGPAGPDLIHPGQDLRLPDAA